VNLKINDTDISNNVADASGGGIYIEDSNLKIENSNISDNAASSGAGIDIRNRNIQGEYRVEINNTVISGNSTEASGGGIYNDGNTILSIDNSIISGNSADEGGGIINTENGILEINNSTINNNSATENGGGILNGRFGFYNTSSFVTNSTISGNSAGNQGGGIYNDYGKSLTLTNSTISGNAADNGGSGIYNSQDEYGTQQGTVTLTSSIVAANLNNNDLAGKGKFVSSGNNLIGNGDNIAGFINTDIVGTTDNPN
jgi:hypothetical protein